MEQRIIELNRTRERQGEPEFIIKDNAGGGDCMFYSLIDSGLEHWYPDIKPSDIREMVREFLKKNGGLMISHMGMTVRQIYDSFKTEYEPNYTAFQNDIMEKSKWNRINADFLLNILTYIFPFVIEIVSARNNDCIIWRFNEEDKPEQKITIGHIPEYHYVGLVESGKSRGIEVDFGNYRKEYKNLRVLKKYHKEIEKELIDTNNQLKKKENIDKCFERKIHLLREYGALEEKIMILEYGDSIDEITYLKKTFIDNIRKQISLK